MVSDVCVQYHYQRYIAQSEMAYIIREWLLLMHLAVEVAAFDMLQYS